MSMNTYRPWHGPERASARPSQQIEEFVNGLNSDQVNDMLRVQIARQRRKALEDAKLIGSLLVSTLRVANKQDAANGIEQTLKIILGE